MVLGSIKQVLKTLRMGREMVLVAGLETVTLREAAAGRMRALGYI
jgi:hypothetical protein